MRNPKTQKTFVLVHDSWQGAWCWDGVREHLRRRGHRVLTPALPGRGAVADDRSWIGPEDNVAAVLLDAQRTHPAGRRAAPCRHGCIRTRGPR